MSSQPQLELGPPHTRAERTLDQARAEYAAAIKGDGMRCPCCNKWGKINPVPLTAPIIARLAFLYFRTEPEGEFIHVPEKGRHSELRGNNVGKLKLWQFAETARAKNGKQKRTGRYRITARGVLFFERKLTVFPKCWTFDDKIVDWDRDELIDVREASRRGKQGFDYDAAMADRFIDRP